MKDRLHFEKLYAQGIFRGRDFVELLDIAFPELEDEEEDAEFGGFPLIEDDLYSEEDEE